MKNVLLSALVLACVTVASAQSSTTLEELKTAYQNVAWENAGELTFNKETHVLAVKNYRIPVSESTDVRAEKTSIHFYMQNNTAVTDVNAPDWKRAEFIIPFKDKKSAAAFVKEFNKLKKE